MAEERIILSGLWVALMLTYLLGDVLRIFAGDFTAGQIDGKEATQMDVGSCRRIHVDPDRDAACCR